MEVGSIKYEKLSYWRFIYNDTVNGIPTNSGIYFWVYWPEFDASTITVNELNDHLIAFCEKNLQFPETLKGTYKFIAHIHEQKYLEGSSPLFGLSESKRQDLLEYFRESRSNIEDFAIIFKEICFARPFYVGKSNNLRSRLANSHFRSKSQIIPEILKQRIPESQIWVGYRLTPSINAPNINTIVEEIISRMVKPGLTKKPN